jgi:hypothetical protein
VAHGKSPVNPALKATEVAAASLVASLVLNMDEAITRE